MKYVGDGFLAFFAGSGHALSAVSAAKQARDQVAGRELVVMLHAGDLFLGETVNTVFLLLAWASKRVPERLAMTRPVADRLGPSVPLSPPRSAQVRGVAGKTTIYVPV